MATAETMNNTQKVHCLTNALLIHIKNRNYPMPTSIENWLNDMDEIDVAIIDETINAFGESLPFKALYVIGHVMAEYKTDIQNIEFISVDAATHNVDLICINVTLKNEIRKAA